MIDRRTFLAAAAGAALLPVAAARTDSRSTRIRTKDATEIHVKQCNSSGRPVILTHAWPLSADIWDYQAVALSNAGYRVISYDRRVFGRSGKPSSGYDFDTFADDLAAVIRAMEFTLTRESNASVRISGNCRLLASELPAVPAMATIVRPDTNVVSHSSFAAIGTWIEANKYEIAGPCREIFLEPITEPPGFERALVEI